MTSEPSSFMNSIVEVEGGWRVGYLLKFEPPHLICGLKGEKSISGWEIKRYLHIEHILVQKRERDSSKRERDRER